MTMERRREIADALVRFERTTGIPNPTLEDMVRSLAKRQLMVLEGGPDEQESLMDYWATYRANRLVYGPDTLEDLYAVLTTGEYPVRSHEDYFGSPCSPSPVEQEEPA